MNHKELRIGNLVYESSYDECYHSYIVRGIEERGLSISVFGKKLIGMYDYKVIKPIPIIEQSLLSFGFRKDVDDVYYKLIEVRPRVFSKLRVFYRINRVMIDFDTVISSEIKHVHQLQNLYFTLTNNELTIND